MLGGREVTAGKELGGFGRHSVAGEETEARGHDLVKRDVGLELLVMHDGVAKLNYEVKLRVGGAV